MNACLKKNNVFKFSFFLVEKWRFDCLFAWKCDSSWKVLLALKPSWSKDFLTFAWTNTQNRIERFLAFLLFLNDLLACVLLWKQFFQDGGRSTFHYNTSWPIAPAASAMYLLHLLHLQSSPSQPVGGKFWQNNQVLNYYEVSFPRSRWAWAKSQPLTRTP